MNRNYFTKTIFLAASFFFLTQFSLIAGSDNENTPEMLISKLVTFDKAAASVKDSALSDVGVAVTPSSLRFSAKPGATITKEVKITNDTKKAHSFKVDFIDFEMGTNGKPVFLPAREGRFSLSKWANVSPTFVELKPGETQKINVTIQVPAGEEGNKAAWCIMSIDQIREKETIEPPDPSRNIAFGIIPSFGFGIYMYQNPPNVSVNKVEITNFEYLSDTASNKFVKIKAKNTGDGIAFCASYVELTNLNTGDQQRLGVKTFTILPEYIRDFTFDLPKDLAPGKYSLVSVLDFGSKEEIEAAELEFNIE